MAHFDDGSEAELEPLSVIVGVTSVADAEYQVVLEHEGELVTTYFKVSTSCVGDGSIEGVEVARTTVVKPWMDMRAIADVVVALHDARRGRRRGVRPER